METKTRNLTQFEEQIIDFVLKNGGSLNDSFLEGMYALQIQTNLGLLLIDPREEVYQVYGKKRGEVSRTVFCRFVDVNRACEVLNPTKSLQGKLNPYSGKWNFGFGGVRTRAAVDSFKLQLQPLLK